MPKTTKHILVIRLSAMGDVAMCVPVLRAFTQQNPSTKITVLTRAFFKPFFRDLENVSVYAIDTKQKHKGFLGLYKLSKELVKLDIDAVADLHNVLRTKILKCFLLGRNFVQIDKGRAEKKALVTGKIFEQLTTTHQRYVAVFKKLGFSVSLSKPTFPEPISLCKETLLFTGNKTTKWIGIAPFAAYKSKMYPLDFTEKVIADLSKNYKILLFGGGKEEALVLKEFENKYTNVLSLAGKFSLNEELNIISNLDVMLAMDSGNSHIAAMLGVKTVTIWGVTHPYAGFAPFNQPTDYALLADREKYPLIPTSIYGNKYPEAYQQASSSINPEKVILKIKEILAG